MIKEVTVQEFKKLKDENANFLLLDVREPSEYHTCNLGGYLIPLNELPQRIDELDPDQTVIVHCRVGGRSAKAVEFLQHHGFVNVYNLKGGITAWSKEIDPSLLVN